MFLQPTMVSWVELVTKQFNASAAASEWFLGHMADNTWWPMQVCINIVCFELYVYSYRLITLVVDSDLRALIRQVFSIPVFQQYSCQ